MDIKQTSIDRQKNTENTRTQAPMYGKKSDSTSEYSENQTESSANHDLEKLPQNQPDENQDTKEAIDIEADKDIDGGYAWVICLTCFILNFSTWGMNSGFAIYFSYYLNHDTFDGASKIDFSYIGGLAFGMGLIFSPILNYLLGKFGLRQTIVLGNCLQFTGLMLASFSKQLWQLYLTQGILQSFGLALITVPNLTLIPQYFKKKRLLAGGLATAGSGVGGICFNLGMQKVLQVKSVWWALRVQSIIGFVLVLVAVCLARNKAEKIKIQFTLYDIGVLRSAAFWIFGFFVITCMFGYVVVLYTLANFTTSLGYSEYQGSIASAMVQTGSCLGRPVVGIMADKYGAATVSAVAYTVAGILCLAMWIPARNFATVIAFGLIQGALIGSIYGMAAPVMARTFGIKKMNVAFSMLWILMGISGLFSPVIGTTLIAGSGNTVDPTQYRYCSVFTGVSFLGSAASLILLRGYIKARDLMDIDHSDSDNSDYTNVTVPFWKVLTSCFKTSHEKT